jgi:hypothetical protein
MVRVRKTARATSNGLTIATAMTMGAALPDVERTTTWGAPTLKVRGKMMACQAINKAAEPNTLVVCMPIPQRDELISADPDSYYLKEHYKDYPCVLVRLSRIHPDAVRDLLRMGWDFARSRAKRKPTPRRTKTSLTRARTAKE